MFRCTVCFKVVVWCTMMGFATLLHAAEPFDLPDCAADFSSEVLLNAPLLQAMIPQAEPDGIRPDRQHETLFIVMQYYLERIQGLLLVTREEPAQRPLLLTDTCAPYPEAPAHIRAYLADLTTQQIEALVAYRDLVRPREHRPSTRLGGMARIPAGAFQRSDGQTVTLEAFAIDVYEVTNAQYGQFIEAAGYTTREFWSEQGWAWLQSMNRQQPSYWENAQLNAPEQPVVGATWYEAEAYCRWAGKALPTELQWEKACRGTDGRRYPWGDEPLPQPTTAAENRPQFTVPATVGSSPQTQSPYGVHDLAGNVLEWTQTRRDGNRQIVLCGGSGDSREHNVGCGVRYTLLPGIAANFIGFRCQSASP